MRFGEIAIGIVALLAAGVLGVALVPVVVAQPSRTILPLYAASIPIGSGFKLPVPLPHPFDSLSTTLGALAIAAMLAHILIHGKGRLPTAPVGFWMVFLAWVTVTLFWAEDRAAATSSLTVAVPLVILVVVVSLLPIRRDAEVILRLAVIFGGVLVGLYALMLVISGSGLQQKPSGAERFGVVSNPSTDHTNPNQVAASLLLPIALATDLLVVGSSHLPTFVRRWRLVGVSGILLPAAAIILSGSRGGVISAGITIVSVFLLWYRHPEFRGAVRRVLLRGVQWALLVAILGSVALLMSPASVRSRLHMIDPIARLTTDVTDSTGRTEIWQTGYLACKSRCDFGVGLGNFPLAYAQTYPLSGVRDFVGLERVAHNTYLGVVVETGIVGLMLLMVCLLVEWKTLSSASLYRYGPGLKAAIVGLLVANAFEDQLWFKYFWIVIVLIRVGEAVPLSENHRMETKSPQSIQAA